VTWGGKGTFGVQKITHADAQGGRDPGQRGQGQGPIPGFPSAQGHSLQTSRFSQGFLAVASGLPGLGHALADGLEKLIVTASRHLDLPEGNVLPGGTKGQEQQGQVQCLTMESEQ